MNPKPKKNPILVQIHLSHTHTEFNIDRNPYHVLATEDAKTDKFKYLLIKPIDALISQIYFVKKFYMFRAVPLPIISSFPLYIRHWYMSCSFDDSYQARPG